MSLINYLVKLANKLDAMGHNIIADSVDELLKSAEQLDNFYYSIGDKGPQFGGNAEQENEAAEEVNDDMENQEQENFSAGKDNIVIDKNSNPTDGFGILGD